MLNMNRLSAWQTCRESRLINVLRVCLDWSLFLMVLMVAKTVRIAMLVKTELAIATHKYPYENTTC